MNDFDEISSSRSCLNENMGPENESCFLEKYFYDLITDNCDKVLTNTIYRTLIDEITDKSSLEVVLSRYIREQIDLQQRQKIHSKYFFTKQQISMKKLTQLFKQLLAPVDSISNTNSTLSHSLEFNKSGFIQKEDFIELLENDYLNQNQEFSQGELIYIDTKFRKTNSQMKEELSKIRQNILKQFLYDTKSIENFYETFDEYYQKKSITILLFVNGDITFDFEKYFDLKELYIGRRRFKIKMKVCYISANRLASNFCLSNNIYHNQITQQNMAFYELKRYGYLKININKTISELSKMKQRNNYSIFKDYKFYIGAIGITIVSAFIYDRYFGGERDWLKYIVMKK